MKKVVLIIAAALLTVSCFSQRVSKITIAGNGYADFFSIGLDENVEIYVTREGNISRWGYDKFIGYQENYSGVLDPYVGRIEYYSQLDDEALRGKIKYIGKTLITWYASYENEALKGKLKSIGTINFDYYLNYEDVSYRGLIKNLGQYSVTWYASYENEALRGKLKTVGSTLLSYYGSFEDKAYRGKIKSIDRFTITYYSSFEQYSGSVKTGAQILNANGVKYFIRNY